MYLGVGLLSILLFSFASFAQTSSESLIEKAKGELTNGSEASVPLQTPATIVSSVEEVTSPITYSALQLGLSYERLQPMGRGKVTGLPDVQWGRLKPVDFVSLEMKWLIYQWNRTYFGTSASLGYGANDLQIYTAMGDKFDRAKLSIVRWNLGFVAEQRFLETWSTSASLGVGQFLMSQSAESNFVSDSRQLGVATAQLSLQKRIARFLIPYVAYQYRIPTARTSSRLDVDRQGVVVGIMGSIR